MGMSASQARLLSITARLTDNELRSQTITNSKLRLAEKSSEASQEYMNALNSEKLTFRYYNNNGESTSYNLTPALLYSYEPLKNQYSIQNASGQNLVSATDAANFEKSANLSEFLSKYGLVDNSELEKYKADKAQYTIDKAEYDAKIKKYNDDKEKYEKALKEPSLYEQFSSIVGTKDKPISSTGYCYDAALKGDAGCYLHLLNLLIDFDGKTLSTRTYKTTTGAELKTNGNKGGTYNQLSDEQKATFATISQRLETQKCNGDEDSLKTKVDAGKTPTELEKLMGDYKLVEKDGATTYELKTLKEKAIDMYYIIQNKGTLGVNNDSMKTMLINFTEGDMQKVALDEPVKPDTKMPEEPTKPEFNLYVTDKDKGQWYVNLWYMMNGSESANKIKSTTNSNGETIYGIDNNDKNSSAQNYKVIEDELLTSTDWLEFALKNGIVTLSQASYFNPSEDSSKTAEYTAEGVYGSQKPYTNASDIVSVQDDAAIARAEVKYKNATTEIENKDKKYDQDLKKLDTQHNALQTEYESLKNVIDKNVERSFKAFS